MIEQLARRQKRLQREQVDERSLSYEFKMPEDEATATLRGLPFTCALWVAYRRFEAAHTEYTEAMAWHQRWRQELEVLAARIQHAKHEADPDTIDYAALARDQLKAEVLSNRCRDPHGIMAELKDVMDRAGETWTQTWKSYQQAKRIEEMAATSEFVPSVGGYDPKGQALREVRTRIRQFEAPQGAL